MDQMLLGKEVGLGPDHTVLDGDPAPLLNKGGTAPNFRPIFTARRNARIASAVLAMALFPSVCPSVRLSHAGIVSKRRHIARCSLHC